jgi:quinoprotein glucose dehydrogenase
VRTGKLLWTFHVVPRKGELGNDSWLNDSWTYSGNSGAWS